MVLTRTSSPRRIMTVEQLALRSDRPQASVPLLGRGLHGVIHALRRRSSLPQIVLARLLQGLCGAALIPLSQAVLLGHQTPPARHARAMACG